MTFLCNPGDRFIHKLIKADSRISYEGWVLKQPLINGKLATPSRSQSAQWHYGAIKKLNPGRLCTHSSLVECSSGGLLSGAASGTACRLKHEQAVRSIKEVLDDDELAAQLDYLSATRHGCARRQHPTSLRAQPRVSLLCPRRRPRRRPAAAPAAAPPPPPPHRLHLRHHLHLCLSTRWPSLSRGRLGL